MDWTCKTHHISKSFFSIDQNLTKMERFWSLTSKAIQDIAIDTLLQDGGIIVLY